MSSDPPRDRWRERLADLAVGGRTAVLRLLSPIERLHRAIRGKRSEDPGPLPPLWLRRHAGPIRAFRSSGAQAMSLLDQLGLLRPDLRVLDFGCGPGSLVPRFGTVLGREGHYRGLDIHAPSVDWCRRSFAGDVRFSFELLHPVVPAPWPAADGSWDLVLAKSVFTHLLEPEARTALSEFRRKLAPGGRAMLTAFLFDGPAFAARALPWFPSPGDSATVRWRRPSRPTAAVAVEAATFQEWISAAGLRVATIVPGFHPGGAAPPTGQDVLILAAEIRESPAP